MVRELAREHQVWVFTRSKNRQVIETELRRCPSPSLYFLYFDIPLISQWVIWRGVIGQLYYYLWHLSIYFPARSLHKRMQFDLCHHVTWGRHWMPNLVALLPIPFVWGPVGGGESIPAVFLRDLGLRGRAFEALRNFARWFGEHDPFVRITAKRTAVALTPTRSTGSRLENLGVKRVDYVSGQVGINKREFESLRTLTPPKEGPIRFLSMGRLLPWKGVHLSLQAFAHAKLTNAELWIVGDGPDRKRLENLSMKLGISKVVTFWGSSSREEGWTRMGQCHVLLHPCLHGLTTTVIVEAMAAGLPVISLNFEQGRHAAVRTEGEFRIDAISPEQAVNEMSATIARLAGDSALCERAGKAASRHVASEFIWECKAQLVSWYYGLAVEKSI
jgi:glycosyltransferase involved in cell wall biosynthesis